MVENGATNGHDARQTPRAAAAPAARAPRREAAARRDPQARRGEVVLDADRDIAGAVDIGANVRLVSGASPPVESDVDAAEQGLEVLATLLRAGIPARIIAGEQGRVRLRIALVSRPYAARSQLRVRGDVRIEAGVPCSLDLDVDGSLEIEDGACLIGDARVRGDLRLGASASVSGQLDVGGTLVLGPNACARGLAGSAGVELSEGAAVLDDSVAEPVQKMAPPASAGIAHVSAG